MRRLSVAVVCVAFGLLLVGAAGCGGGDEAAGDDAPLATTETDDTQAAEAGGIDADECLDLADAGFAISQAFESAGWGGSDDLGSAAALFDRLVDRAPEEIQADIRTLGAFHDQYAAVLSEVGLESGELPTDAQLAELEAALASIDQSEVQGAAERVVEWASITCGG